MDNTNTNNSRTKNKETINLSLFDSLWHFVATDIYADCIYKPDKNFGDGDTIYCASDMKIEKSKICSEPLKIYFNKKINFTYKENRDFSQLQTIRLKTLDILKKNKIKKKEQCNIEASIDKKVYTLPFFTNENYERSYKIFCEVFNDKNEQNDFMKILKTIKIKDFEAKKEEIVDFEYIFDLERNVVLETFKNASPNQKGNAFKEYNNICYSQIPPITSVQLDICLNVLQIITLKLQEVDYIKFRRNNFSKDGLPYTYDLINKIYKNEIIQHPIYGIYCEDKIKQIEENMRFINNTINENYIKILLDFYYECLKNFAMRNKKIIVEYDFKKIIDAYEDGLSKAKEEKHAQAMKGKKLSNKTSMERNKLIISLNKILDEIKDIKEAKEYYKQFKHTGNKNL